MRSRFVFAGLLLVLGSGCRGPESEPSSLPGNDVARRVEVTEAPAAETTAAPEEGQDEAPLVVFLGDSLTAGLGLGEEQAFPAIVGERLAAEGVAVRVVNAGVSGDTSAGGLRRLSWVLRQGPEVIVVGLGANDGLRGLQLAETERNLREIVRRGRETGARVVLLGMRIPPNYGPEYAEGFAGLYPRIAAELEVPFVPFLLDGVGGEPELNLPDGIHPNADGHERVAQTVMPVLREVLAAESSDLAAGS